MPINRNPEPEFMCEHPTNHTYLGRNDYQLRVTVEAYDAAYADGNGPALCPVCVSQEHAAHAF